MTTQVTTGLIADNAVTAGKLADTLDLSAKTLTLSNAQKAVDYIEIRDEKSRCRWFDSAPGHHGFCGMRAFPNVVFLQLGHRWVTKLPKGSPLASPPRRSAPLRFPVCACS